MGDAMLGKKLGKGAMFLGALAQSIPDIDFVAALWNDTASNLLAHRGFTHSILFDVLMTILFAWLAEHFHKSHKVGYRQWMLFFGVQISAHIIVDLMNNYGVGLFEPISHIRVAFHTLFVADPFFSIWPAISFVFLLILKSRSDKRRFWHRFALSLSALYLIYCGINKYQVNQDVREALKIQSIPYNNYFTTPTPLNNWLWYVVAQVDSGYYVGYRSVFEEGPMPFHFFPRNHHLLSEVRNPDEVQNLIRFSQGYYTVERWNDTLVFNDLRFGQIVGWHDPTGHFAFHFYLNHPDDQNTLVVQRGRFARWNEETLASMLRRIKGN